MKTHPLMLLVVFFAFPLFAPEYDIVQHGKECAEKMGEIPDFDCQDGTEIPITVNGVRVTEDNWRTLDISKCDRPALLSSSGCHPFSRLVHFKNGPVDTQVICRRYVDKPKAEDGFQDVAIIQFNKETNEACFFQMLNYGGQKTGKPPAPFRSGRDAEGDRAAVNYWLSPRETAGITCIRCHEASIWIHTPWLDQVKDKNAVDHNPWSGDMKVIGEPFQSWRKAQRYSINQKCYDQLNPPTDEQKKKEELGQLAPSNACTRCHNLGQQFWQQATYETIDRNLSEWGQKFPHSHWMPPELPKIPLEGRPGEYREMKDAAEYREYYRRAFEADAYCTSDISNGRNSTCQLMVDGVLKTVRVCEANANIPTTSPPPLTPHATPGVRVGPFGGHGSGSGEQRRPNLDLNPWNVRYAPHEILNRSAMENLISKLPKNEKLDKVAPCPMEPTQDLLCVTTKNMNKKGGTHFYLFGTMSVGGFQKQFQLSSTNTLLPSFQKINERYALFKEKIGASVSYRLYRWKESKLENVLTFKSSLPFEVTGVNYLSDPKLVYRDVASPKKSIRYELRGTRYQAVKGMVSGSGSQER